MKFIVKYSQKRDLQNYIGKIWKRTWTNYGDSNKENFYRWAPKEFINNLMAAPDQKSAENIVKQYWKNTFPPSFENDNKFLINWFSRLLNEEKDLIIKRLEKAYNKPFPFGDITVYVTTSFSCPYNYEKLVNQFSTLLSKPD